MTGDARARRGEGRAAPIGRVRYRCAFCGRKNTTLADASGGRRQTYTEDCRVCCRPNLLILVLEEDGTVQLDVTQEYEA